MISFITPEDQFPFDTAPLAAEIVKAHHEFTSLKLQEALIAKFGEIPPLEEIAAHCMKFIDQKKVSHYVWFDGEKPKLGEKPDMSGLLCSIDPPFPFKLEN